MSFEWLMLWAWIGCWPSRENIQASGNVFANGRGVHRQSDQWDVHCCPAIPECHSGVLASGSPNVITNNLQTGRCGDPVNCGSYVITCSGDVIIN